MRKSKAQATLEVSILIAVIAAALLASIVYVKRALQGKLRESADSVGEQYSPARTFLSTRNSTNSTVSYHTYQYDYNSGPFGSTLTSQKDTDETNTQEGYEVTGDAKDEPFF
jgi:hypothetical protein